MQQKSGTLNVDMINGGIIKPILIFAIPIFISNLFQQFYNTVDTMIVGHVLGDSAVASIGAVSPVYEMLVGFAVGVSGGLSIVAARCFGMRDLERLKRASASAFIISIAISLIITALSLILMTPLLKLLRTPGEIFAQAENYIYTIIAFAGVTVLYNLLASLMRAVGNSFMPLVFLIISSCINVVLDIAFVKYLGMGVRGAALATVMAESISVILSIIYMIKKCPELIPSKRHFRIEKDLFRDMLTQGLSSGSIYCVVSIGTVILQFGINGFGDAIIAGHTVARRVFAVLSMPFSPIALSATTFVSQNMGAWRWDRIGRAVRLCSLLCIGIALISCAGVLIYARQMITGLSGSSDEELIKNGSLYLMISSPFYVVLAVLVIMRNSLQAIGEKLLPLFSSLIELVGKILFVVFIVPKSGYMGVIFCEPIIWCFMTVQLTYAFYKAYRKRNKKRKPESAGIPAL